MIINNWQVGDKVQSIEYRSNRLPESFRIGIIKKKTPAIGNITRRIFVKLQIPKEDRKKLPLDLQHIVVDLEKWTMVTNWRKIDV